MKTVREHIIHELIPAVIAGEANAEELKQLEEWLAENDENKRFFEEIKEVWEMAEEMPVPDADASWNDLKRKIGTAANGHSSPLWKYWAAAAVVGLFVGIGFLINGNGTSVNSVLALKKENIQLKDGSVVYLNANAEFSYPLTFDGSTREVELKKGEAFFEVERNPEKPFIIHAGKVSVTVLGTSFNTKVNEDSVEVIVSTGKVSVEGENGKAMLTPGKRAVYYLKQEKILSGENSDPNFLAWKSGLLVFNNTPVHVVLNKVAELYGVQIEYNVSDVAGRQLTGRYKTDNLEQLLQVITMSVDLDLDTANNRYMITANKQVVN